MLSHGNAFRHRRTFPQTYFYIGMMLDWAASHAGIYACKQRWFCKRMGFHAGFFIHGCFTQAYCYMFSGSGAHFVLQNFSKKLQNRNTTAAFDGRDAGRGKGLAPAQAHIAISFLVLATCMPPAFPGHQSRLPCRPTRKFLKLLKL